MKDGLFRSRPTQPLYARCLWLSAAIAAGGLVLAGCQSGKDNASQATATKAAAQNLATQVSVTRAKSGSIQDIANVTGALNALQDVTVGVKSPGKIVAVYVREGDFVRNKQIVAQQDTTDLRNQLDSQRANLVASETRLNAAQVTYKNAVTTLKLTDEQTLSAVRQAQAALEAAKDQAAVIKQGARAQEVQQAKENVAAAKADRDKARADLKRYQDLYREQAVSAQELDQVQSIADSADARYNAAVQALNLSQEGNRPEDIHRAQAAVEQANQAVITAQVNRQQVELRHQDVENARVSILTAQATVDQAKAAVRLAAQALADASIRSPMDGVVAERKVEPGTMAGVTRDVARIVALDSIYFDAQLSETQYHEVVIGQGVRVMVDALPGRTFSGSVSKIFPVASASARSFTLRIRIRNEGNALRPQMFARGEIQLAVHPNAILVPHDAVLDISGNTGRVFLAVKNTAVEKKVKIGFSNANDIEILSGVKAGDPVITLGQAQLQNGDKVQILSDNRAPQEQTSSTAPPKM